MRYRLSTLMVLLALVPPLLASFWRLWQFRSTLANFPPLILVIVAGSLAVLAYVAVAVAVGYGIACLAHWLIEVLAGRR
jgi:hypothetical protein